MLSFPSLQPGVSKLALLYIACELPQVHSVTCFWSGSYKLEVSKTLCLDLINLLASHRAPRNLFFFFFLLDYWFITKGHNSETSRWKRYIGQRMRKGWGEKLPCSLDIPLFLNFPMSMDLGTLQTLSFCILSACKAGDQSLIPVLGRSTGEGNGNPLQYTCLHNPVDRGVWRAIVHGVAKSWTEWLTHMRV